MFSIMHNTDQNSVSSHRVWKEILVHFSQFLQIKKKKITQEEFSTLHISLPQTAWVPEIPLLKIYLHIIRIFRLQVSLVKVQTALLGILLYVLYHPPTPVRIFLHGIRKNVDKGEVIMMTDVQPSYTWEKQPENCKHLGKQI